VPIIGKSMEAARLQLLDVYGVKPRAS
jgi:hypothetical protein